MATLESACPKTQLLVAPDVHQMALEITALTVPSTIKPQALVFEGGGTKGIHYAGAIKRLDEVGLLDGISCFAGTSAGAQTAALLAFGYSGVEMEILMQTIPWNRLLDGSSGCCGIGCCKGLYRLRCHHAYYQGKFMEDFLDLRFADKFGGKRQVTFRELLAEKGVQLRVGACNMSTRCFEYLDAYSHPDLPVSTAVRASSAIPLVFLPQEIGDGIYVDGMFQGNLPVAAFPGVRVLAFHLLEQEVAVAPRRKTLRSFIADILEMMMCSAQRKHGINFGSFVPDDARHELLDILEIDCGTHGALETTLTPDEIVAMCASGRAGAENYLQEKSAPSFTTVCKKKSEVQLALEVQCSLCRTAANSRDEALRIVRSALAANATKLEPSDAVVALQMIQQALSGEGEWE